MTRFRKALFIGACTAAAIAVGTLLGTLERARGQVTAVGPWATVTTGVANVTAVQIGAANASRRAFEICNGAGAAIYILPATNPAGVAVLPTTTSGIPLAASTCFIPPANLLASGSAFGGGQAWNAIAQAAGPTVVAFIEW